MIIVVDGNDGTGKSTIVKRLLELGYDVRDRGLPTKLTDNPKTKLCEGEFYLILDAPVKICRERLKKAGRNLNEQYHTVKDLTHYRKRFLEVARLLSGSCAIIDASKSVEGVLNDSLKAIKENLKEDAA